MISDSQVLAIIRIGLAYIIGPIAIKNMASATGREERFFINYVFVFSLALIVATWLGEITINGTFLFIVGIGFLQAFGAYCQWRAMDISLSRTSLLEWLDDLIVVFLAFVLLNESANVTAIGAVGILLAFTSAILLAYLDYRSSEAEGKRVLVPAVVIWAMGFSFIWGITSFLIKPMMDQGVSVATFALGWYLGSLCTASIILLIKYKRSGIRMPTRADYTLSAVLAGIIFGSLALHAAAFAAGPVTSSQPLFLIAEATLPALLGLYWFREIKHLDWKKQVVILIGFAGFLGIVVGI